MQKISLLLLFSCIATPAYSMDPHVGDVDDNGFVELVCPTLVSADSPAGKKIREAVTQTAAPTSDKPTPNKQEASRDKSESVEPETMFFDLCAFCTRLREGIEEARQKVSFEAKEQWGKVPSVEFPHMEKCLKKLGEKGEALLKELRELGQKGATRMQAYRKDGIPLFTRDTSGDAAELARLRQENAELRTTNAEQAERLEQFQNIEENVEELKKLLAQMKQRQATIDT